MPERSGKEKKRGESAVDPARKLFDVLVGSEGLSVKERKRRGEPLGSGAEAGDKEKRESVKPLVAIRAWYCSGNCSLVLY